MKRLIVVILLIVSMISSISAEVFSLDTLRAYAIRNNKELKKLEATKEAAHWQHKSAVTHYMPRIDGTAGYIRTGKEVSILSHENIDILNALGGLLPIPIDVKDLLRTDTRNIGMAAVILTQPIYMGGKIRAFDKITGYAEQIAEQQHETELRKVIVEVDETYFMLISLQEKRQLAEKFHETIAHFDNDVQAMIREGIATEADGLSIKVKLNESEVTLIQIDNALDLLRMKMCQLCGLASDYALEVNSNESDFLPQDVNGTVDRPELRSLSLLNKVYEEKVKVARGEYLPNLALIGGYQALTPNLYNGFQKKMEGDWFVGVMLKIPILTCGDRIYKLRQARAEATAAKFQYEDVAEKINLQVSQCRSKLTEAQKRLAVTNSSIASADENLRRATLGQREGVIPVSNVLEAQTAWLAAHSANLDAKIDVRLAETYLRQALGLKL